MWHFSSRIDKKIHVLGKRFFACEKNDMVFSY